MRVGTYMIAFASVAALADDAEAAKFLLTSTSVVSTITTFDHSNVSDPLPGAMRLGDSVTVKALVDMSAAKLESSFAGKSTIHIYYLPASKISLNIGTYYSIFSPSFDFNSTLQLWNDYKVTPSLIVDSENFNFFNYNFAPINGYAFDTGAGMRSESISVNNFNFTASARNSDLISKIEPLNLFGAKTFTYVLGNYNSGKSVVVSSSNVVSSLIAISEGASFVTIMTGALALMSIVGLRRQIGFQHQRSHLQ